MSDNKLSSAEIADRHRQYMAFAMLCVAAMFLTKALIHLVGAEIEMVLDIIQVALALLAVGLLVPIFVWKARHSSRSERLEYFSTDGFAAQALMFAQKRSWAITFILMVMLESLNNTLSRFPYEFSIQIVITVMLASMSLLFLYKTRSEGGLAMDGGGNLYG